MVTKNSTHAMNYKERENLYDTFIYDVKEVVTNSFHQLSLPTE